MAAPTTVEKFNASAVTKPKLAAGTVFTPVAQTVKSGELLKNKNLSTTALNQTATQGTTSTATSAQPKDAATYNAEVLDPNAAKMKAAQGELSEQAQVEAAQGTLSSKTNKAFDQAVADIDAAEVDPRSLVQNQYAELMDFGPDEVPGWAKGAMRTAMQAMAARGLGSSTMMGEAVTAALMQAALPIASQDAKVFENMTLAKLDKKAQAAFLKAGYLAQMDMQNLNNRQQAAVVNAQNFLQMDLANLDNRQQAAIVNTQSRIQTLLSNQAAQNAAKQFNAASENQVNQFYDSLASQISMFNSAQRNEMSRFNAGEVNAMKKFNAQLQDAREQFNTNNQILIDQANAQYLRAINTQNTAMKNQANYVNSQNLLNISNTALANQMLLLRDREAFAFTHAENERNRHENRALAILQFNQQKELMDKDGKGSLWKNIGNWAFNALSNLWD